MEIGQYKTQMVLLITGLWVAITLCGWFGHWYIGLHLSVVLMLLHMMMGAAQNGKLDRKLLVYPMLTWAVVWIIGFVLAKQNSDAFLNMAPTYKIFGFHPSFAWIILCYWIGGVLTLTIGFVKYKNLWLSDEAWDRFTEKMKQFNKGGQ
ncbi:hypothetical protein KHM83_01805 [Fusibacter paucivorans]|uniref:Uncharacterized protein n=1 Tax=Fusibacter paucivorans TaxID=76009 RepID=A0ABS5PMY2_9FIRM|nr:hypothetical protein [Fusibacter paucivorans]MBS7525407.1 hypothetical protein [Fusibacter paucivorans]